jgi:tungstate transport system permease protein
VDLIWEGFIAALRLLATGDPQTYQIAARSLLVSGLATALATAIGVPLGSLLALGAMPGRRLLAALVNTGMGLPPVVVGLGVSILLWRSGPLGDLALLYTPSAMILAQCIVATPLATGLTASALGLLDRELIGALRADGAREWRVGWELVRAARAQVLVAIAAAFGRAISEVGASLMVGGNILNQTRILTTAITLETGKGDFARAIALGLILLALAFVVNAGLVRQQRPGAAGEGE